MTELLLTLTVNGESSTGSTGVTTTLADYLRERLRLTGTHLGCEHGVCGACTVLFDGEPVRACLMLAVQAAGHDVVTIEGLSANPGGAIVQSSLREAAAFQCGFCTPGFLSTITAYVSELEEPPSRAEIRRQLAGNLCRCSGY